MLLSILYSQTTVFGSPKKMVIFKAVDSLESSFFMMVLTIAC